MAEENQLSRAGLQFGEDFEGDGALYFKINLDFNTASSNELIDKVKSLTNNTFDASWQLVIAFSVSPDKKAKFLEAIEKLKTQKPEDESAPQAVIYEFVSTNKIELKTYEGEGKIYLGVRLIEGFDEIEGTFDTFFGQGFSELVESQKNSLSLSFSSNTSIDQMLKQLDEGERLLSVLLTSARIVLELQLNKDFGIKLKESVANIEPDFANSPPFVFLRYFKGLDIDVRFASAQDLPEDIRKKYLFGKFLQDKPLEALKLPESEPKLEFLNVLLDTLDADLDIYFAVPKLLSFHAHGHAPLLSNFIRNYGGPLLQI